MVDACEAAGAEAGALVTAALRRRIGDPSGEAEAQGGAAPPAMPTVEAMVDDTLLNPNPNPNPNPNTNTNPNPIPNPKPNP